MAFDTYRKGAANALNRFRLAHLHVLEGGMGSSLHGAHSAVTSREIDGKSRNPLEPTEREPIVKGFLHESRCRADDV